MKPYALLFLAFIISSCMTKTESNNPTGGDLWVFDSANSFPKYPSEFMMFNFLEDSLHMLGKAKSTMWKTNTCYYPDRNIEFVRSGDSIFLINTNDSIWSGPKIFYKNNYGELQSDSADTTKLKLFFRKATSYPDCNELFSKDFQLTLKKSSTENELYANRRFDLNLDYSINGTGYGYSSYEIKIDGGPILLGSYTKHREFYDSASLSNRGSISLTIPLDSLYDSLAENIRIQINLGGHTPAGLEWFYGKEILYKIRHSS